MTEAEAPMAFLSISIDLCGSTLAKQALVELSGNNMRHRKDLYEQYTKILYEMEREFYVSLMDIPAVDFSRLYLIKTIGDEYWYAYDVDENNQETLGQVASAFFEALMDLFAEERYLAFDGSLPRSEESLNKAASLPAKEFDLPIKAYIDLIAEPIELNRERYEYLKDIVSVLRGGKAPVYNVDRDYINICNRLNLGAADIFEDKYRVYTRTDFIGLEIDRFFRMTKFSKPLLVGVGQTLMEKLDFEIEPAAPHLEHIGVQVLALNVPSDSSYDPTIGRKYVISEGIPADLMKGVSGDYMIYHLFGGNSLGDAIYAPRALIETLMESTRAFLAESGFYALERDHLLP